MDSCGIEFRVTNKKLLVLFRVTKKENRHSGWIFGSNKSFIKIIHIYLYLYLLFFCFAKIEEWIVM